jgi:hypothetical protein
MDLPDISVDSVAEKKGVITHFAVAVDHMDRVAAKHLADKINSEFPDGKREMRIRPIPAARRSISGIPTASSCKSRRKTGAERKLGIIQSLGSRLRPESLPQPMRVTIPCASK